MIGIGLERGAGQPWRLDSTGKWRILVATEKADHAQVERSSGPPVSRTEPASDRPQVFHLAEHGHEYVSAAQSGALEVAMPETWGNRRIGDVRKFVEN